MPPPTILIWQADGGAGHDLAFMYEPVRSTLVSGFSDLPQRVISKIGTPHLVHGHGVHALFRKKADLVNGLKTGDIFLWIGPVGSNAPPWRKLRERGVRTIYYQTEPFDGCQLSGSQSDEVWEFSWHNIDACGPRLRLDPPLTLRYVPLGYNAPPAAESSGSSSASAPPVTDGTEKADLLFLLARKPGEPFPVVNGSTLVPSSGGRDANLRRHAPGVTFGSSAMRGEVRKPFPAELGRMRKLLKHGGPETEARAGVCAVDTSRPTCECFDSLRNGGVTALSESARDGGFRGESAVCSIEVVNVATRCRARKQPCESI